MYIQHLSAEHQYSLGPAAPLGTADSGGLAHTSDVGHHNGKATPAGTRHQPLTCLNSWNVWHCLPPEICRATGKGVERKEEGEGGWGRGEERGMGGMVAELGEGIHSSAIGDHCAEMAPSRN